MNPEESIIELYLRLESVLRDVLGDIRLRSRGFSPYLTDIEALTLEIFSECCGITTKK